MMWRQTLRLRKRPRLRRTLPRRKHPQGSPGGVPGPTHAARHAKLSRRPLNSRGVFDPIYITQYSLPPKLTALKAAGSALSSPTILCLLIARLPSDCQAVFRTVTGSVFQLIPNSAGSSTSAGRGPSHLPKYSLFPYSRYFGCVVEVLYCGIRFSTHSRRIGRHVWIYEMVSFQGATRMVSVQLISKLSHCWLSGGCIAMEPLSAVLPDIFHSIQQTWACKQQDRLLPESMLVPRVV